jgi:hypothetical protein
MPQEQRVIPLVLFRRAPSEAVGVADYAAWICVCRRSQPLLGRAATAQPVLESSKVKCPDCGRGYVVVAATSGKEVKAVEVREV